MLFILVAILIWGSIILAPVTFIIAVVRQSWKWMLIAFVTVVPFCLYLLSGEPPVFWFGFLPIIHLILAVILFYKAKHTKRD